MWEGRAMRLTGVISATLLQRGRGWLLRWAHFLHYSFRRRSLSSPGSVLRQSGFHIGISQRG